MFFYSMILFYTCMLLGADNIKTTFPDDDSDIKLLCDSNALVTVKYKYFKQSKTLTDLFNDYKDGGLGDFLNEGIPLPGYSKQHIEKLFQIIRDPAQIPACTEHDFFPLVATANRLEVNNVIKMGKEKFLEHCINNTQIPHHTIDAIQTIKPDLVMDIVSKNSTLNELLNSIPLPCKNVFNKEMVCEEIYKIYEPLKATLLLDSIKQNVMLGRCESIYHSQGGGITLYDRDSKEISWYNLKKNNNEFGLFKGSRIIFNQSGKGCIDYWNDQKNHTIIFKWIVEDNGKKIIQPQELELDKHILLNMWFPTSENKLWLLTRSYQPTHDVMYYKTGIYELREWDINNNKVNLLHNNITHEQLITPNKFKNLIIQASKGIRVESKEIKSETIDYAAKNNYLYQYIFNPYVEKAVFTHQEYIHNNESLLVVCSLLGETFPSYCGAPPDNGMYVINKDSEDVLFEDKD